jgi:hypothetical protein
MLLPTDEVLIVEQSVFGTPVTAGQLSLPIREGTAEIVPQPFKSERKRVSGVGSLPGQGWYHYSFTLEAELEPSHLPIFFKSLMGNYAFAADTPESGANTHTIKFTSTLSELQQIYNKGLTIEFGSFGKYYTLDSAIITGITIAPPDQGVINVTITGLAREKSEDTSSAGTYSVNNPPEIINTFQLEVKAGVDASEVIQPTTNFGLTLTRAAEPQFIQSSQNAQAWIIGEVLVTGSFEIGVNQTERTAVLDDFNNADKASIIYTGTSSQIITAAYKKWTFDVPEIIYTNVGPRNDGLFRYEMYEFEAGLDTGSDIITATAINSEATL